VVGLVVSGVAHRQRTAHWSETEREVRENTDGQIRAMLFQAGGPLGQDRIRSDLDVPPDELAETLEATERRGEIMREWLPLEYTYRIRLAPTRGEDTQVTGDPSVAPRT